MKRCSDEHKLPYSSYINEQTALDAVEWCKNHKGHGEFNFAWLLKYDQHSENETLALGLFGFSDGRDHIMFNMMWI